MQCFTHMKHLMVRIPEDLHRQMRMIAVQEDSSLQQIILELISGFIADRHGMAQPGPARHGVAQHGSAGSGWAGRGKRKK